MGSPFESIVGGAHVHAAPASTLDGAPILQIVCPADAAEIAECMRLASLDGIPIVVRGGGTKLHWGNASSVDAWVMLDVSRLTSPLEIHADEGIARVAAGVPTEVLAERLREFERSVRIPAGYAGSTVGGSIAADPPSSSRTLDTLLRNDLLGLEVVLADGSRTRCGGNVVKNVTGFDLVRLYCGSMGTLGVLTEITLRLRPAPPARLCLSRRLDSIEAAQALLAELVLKGVHADAAVLRARPGGALELMWLLEGAAEDVQERSERVPGEPEPLATWDELERCEGGSRPRDGAARIRLSARTSDLAELWRVLATFGGEDMVGPAFPLMGTVWADGDPATLPSLCALATQRRWTWLIECLPASEKPKHAVMGPLPSSLSLLRTVKQRFDPSGILAPGRFMGGL